MIGSFNQGGSERQAVALCRALKADGTFDVFAATLNNEGALLSEIDAVGLPEIPEFPLTSFYNASFVRQVRLCAKYLKENKIDIVHTHDFYTNVFGMAAATLAGVKARVASKRETEGMRTGSQEFVEKLAFGRSQAIVANSAAVLRHLVERGIASDKINVVYNGLDLSRFETLAALDKKKYGLPTGESIRFITLVANLRHSVKNIPMFLRVAKRVSEILPGTNFVVAGEGGLHAELSGVAEELGIGNSVHFIGRCDDVPALLSASYACVLTSTAEGFSNSILEYMAAGKPVVATNVGGANEAIVENETGFLVESDDDETMSGRLIELLHNEERARLFGKNGEGIIAGRFSLDAQIEKTREMYHRLTK